MKKAFIFISLLFMSNVFAQTIDRFSIDSGGASTAAGNISILYTIGEVQIAERNTATLSISEGFIAPQRIRIRIHPIVFLQGAFTNPNAGEESLMRDDLRIASSILIPTTSPYDSTTCDPSVFTTTGANAIVDWILIELRDENDASNVLVSQSALLQRDGDIVATDGTSAVAINSPSGNYYIAVRHRNHLGILTASTVSLSETVTNLDLSTDINAVIGGALALRAMGNGIFAMYAGDVNSDGSILNTDIASALSASGGINVYAGSDANMDGNILNTDIALIIQPNAGRIQQF
ncbi:hemagglutinin protein [uncultured Dokdonia sp.]|uniref:hemagglutinin protein n=1 Tax=uncultured Dokdonia sp. TaxID=575653 RepID=UPI0026277410|nr:hemagglutinin protein [uncultured Dokdonia sp.]